MFKEALKRFLSLFISLIMVISVAPAVSATDDTVIPSDTRIELPDIINASGEDVLMSVATVSTGGSASSYVDIDSTYVPSGYITPQTSSADGYRSDPDKLSSYHTDKDTVNGANNYLVTVTDDLSWKIDSSQTGINGSLSATAVSDVAGGCDGNGAMCAKVNSKVIRIYAKTDITLSFDWSASMKMTKWQGDKAGSIQEGVFALVTSNVAPSVTDLLKGTEISKKKLTENSPVEASDNGDDWMTALEAGKYLYLYFYGFFNNEINTKAGSDKYTFSASISDFKITPATESYILTIGNRDCANNMIGGGKIGVNGSAVSIPSSGSTVGLNDALNGTAVTLSLSQLPSGYFHIGWCVENEIIFEKTYSFSLTANTTVYALLIPQVTVTMGSNGYSNATYAYKNPTGTSVNAADQYIARNSGATIYYKTLNEAFNDTNDVVLLGNIVLNGDFTIPNGKTLSIQHDWNDPATTELQHSAGNTSVSIFAKATINGTVTLQGSLVASAMQSYTDGVNGRAAGGVGQFIINGTVNVASTGRVYAYGMVTGSGQINVMSGGKVYELMEIRDMRSIYVMPDVATGGAFPTNHFFIKTNEVMTTYNKGAELKACYYIAISGQRSYGEITAIGTSNDSMFIIKRGSITKSFSSSSIYNNKIIFCVNDDSDVQTGSFSITVQLLGITRNIDTNNYEVPLNYCYAIEILNGGSMTLNHSYKLLPGALIDVKEGGTLTIASGKKLILYRANDYGFPAMSGFSATAYPTSFTKPSGLSYPSNTAANVGSAKLNVDGTLNVEGGLYVTNQLTNATSYSNGYNYLTGEGTINITGTLSNGTIKEWTQSDAQNATSITVSYVTIKGITNPNADTDDGQTDYNSLTKKTWYGHINSNGVNYWDDNPQTTNTYTVTWKNEDGTVLETDTDVAEGATPEYNGATPTKASTAEYAYTFAGWTPEVSAVMGDVTYTATYTATKRSYTITWKNEDGTVIDTTTVEYGATPTHADPVKEATVQYTYTFTGWTPRIKTVTGDATYTAVFNEVLREYTITFVDYDDSVLQTRQIKYGVKAGYDGVSPTRESDAQYEYTFADWTPALDIVTGDATYKATYTARLRKYMVTFYDENGEYVWQKEYNYGETPAYGGTALTKPATDQHTYTFAGWATELGGEVLASLPTVTGTAKYYAVFTEAVNTYTVTWVIDGEEETEEYEYGATPTHDNPVKAPDAQYTYTFTGWSPAIATVTGDATYTAQFSSTVNKYTITWVIDGVSTTETYEYGATPSHDDPVKAATAQYTYTFTGWNPEIVPVTGNATYTAVFTEEVNKYTVTWVNWNGTVLETDENVPYGTTPTYDGAAPEREPDVDKTYIFSTWNPKVSVVTGNVTYTAQFNDTIRVYTITFVDYDDTVIKTRQIKYGVKAGFDGDNPTRESDDQYDYTFDDWTPTLAIVTGDATYKAVYKAVLRKYIVVFYNENGDWVWQKEYDYGSTPVYNGPTLTKTATDQCAFEFAGWSDTLGGEVLATLPNVTGVARYYAVFTAIDHNYELTGWTWAEDYSTATATFTCENDNTHVETVNATITSETTDATCEAAGKKVYTATVTFEGETYTDTKEETIPATGHTYGEPTWEWADDYNTATATFTCKKDGTHVETVNATITSVTTAATCEADGKTVYTATVEFEGKTYTDTKEETIPAKGHDYELTGWTWAEDYSTATAKFTCENDSTHVETVNAAITSVTTDATCETAGKTVYTATVEFKGETYTDTKEEPIPATGHDYKLTGWTWAEDYSTATAKFTCENDNTHVETVNATITSETTDATCETAGKTVYTATVEFEGKTYTDTKEKTIPATGHDYELTGWTWTGYTAATATFTCKNDNTHVKTVNATITRETTDATCEAAGKKVYTATVTFEGKTYTDKKEETIPATGHDWGTPTYTWADDYSTVTATMVCAHDASHVETETVDTTSAITKPATCEAKGETTYTATFTNTAFAAQTKTVENIDALGHEWNAPTYEWSTDNSSVTATRVCAHDANHVETETVNTTSAITKPATCEAKGETTYTATFTNPAFVAQTKTVENIDALGHKWNEPTYTWADDNSTVTATRTCKNDPEHVETETVSTTSEVTKPATCEAKGETTYTATIENEAFATQTKTVENIKALGHDYEEGEWSWSEDFRSATLTLVCKNDPAHTKTVTATVTSSEGTGENIGHTVYTATAEDDGKTYTNEKIIKNKYTITFVNYDGTVLQSGEVEYGEKPVYNGETPYKAPDETNVYVFAGWDPEITTVTGNATYTAVFEAETTVWTGPVWSWTDFAENGFDATAKATATFTSGEMTTAKTVDVTGELVKIDGKDTTYAYKYTATVEFNGQTYTNEYSREEFEAVTLIGQTPTLNGVLSINFRFQAPENAATVKFVYEFNGTEVELRLVKDGPYFVTEDGSGRYKIAYTNIQSACITKNVTMKVYDADGNEMTMIRLDKNFYGTEFSYCMADWAKSMLDNPKKPEETKQLAHAILNYGYYASEYFGEKNGNAEKYSFNYEKYGEYLDLSMVENVTVDHENDAVGADEAKANTSYKGALVVLEGSTSIRLYFDSTKAAPTVKDAAGKAYTVYKNDIGYYVEVSGIGSGNLNRKYTFVITGEDGVDYTVKYSVLSWANAMITRGNGENNKYEKTVNLAKALYQYWAAADAYFAIH